jgi:hypothetical protein
MDRRIEQMCQDLARAQYNEETQRRYRVAAEDLVKPIDEVSREEPRQFVDATLAQEGSSLRSVIVRLRGEGILPSHCLSSARRRFRSLLAWPEDDDQNTLTRGAARLNSAPRGVTQNLGTLVGLLRPWRIVTCGILTSGLPPAQ